MKANKNNIKNKKKRIKSSWGRGSMSRPILWEIGCRHLFNYFLKNCLLFSYENGTWKKSFKYILIGNSTVTMLFFLPFMDKNECVCSFKCTIFSVQVICIWSLTKYYRYIVFSAWKWLKEIFLWGLMVFLLLYYILMHFIICI